MDSGYEPALEGVFGDADHLTRQMDYGESVPLRHLVCRGAPDPEDRRDFPYGHEFDAKVEPKDYT